MQFIQLIFIIVIIILIKTSSLVRHSQDIFSLHKTFIESHRGVNREIFQNTLKAVEKAIEYGIESIETDVWLTKDNVAVILHGGTKGELEGYYNCKGFVRKSTWEKLSKCRTIEDNLPMPKLEEMMELTKDKIFMNLEIKDKRYDLVFKNVVNLIERYDFFEQIAISSFHHGYYKKIVKYNQVNYNTLVFGFLYHGGKQSKFDFTKSGNTLNIYWGDATKEICKKAHANGMAIQSWFYYDEEENAEIYKQLFENGVDAICSNKPFLAKIFRDDYFDFD